MKVFRTHVLPVSTLAAALGAILGSTACGDQNSAGGYFLLEPPPVTNAETEPTAPKIPDERLPDVAQDDAGAPAVTCDTAKSQLLMSVDKTSTGEVRSAERPASDEADGGSARAAETVLVIDATAGGFEQASRSPRVYVNLATRERVDVTDVSAAKSTAWDLSLKRATIFTNSGDAGIGQGGALFLAGKTFAEVNLASIGSKKFATERFVDEQCTPQADEVGAPQTSFAGWYEYQGDSMRLSAKKGIHVVRRGTTYFKIEIQSYYGDATVNAPQSSAMYVLRVAELAE